MKKQDLRQEYVICAIKNKTIPCLSAKNRYLKYMSKCPWCNSLRASTTDKFNGYCSAQCVSEMQKYKDKSIANNYASEKGYFRMVTEAITRCFTEYSIFKNRDQDAHLREFLTTSPIVDMWLDCTDNFEKEKLIKYYDEKTKL